MDQQVAAALDALRKLGTPDGMRALARQGCAPQPQPRVNSHIHLPPNFSAFESVEQAVRLAAEQGIGALGVSNYYDYQVYGEFVRCARQQGIFPLFGTEIICLDAALRDAGIKINDPGNPGKIYFCGKGITRFDVLTAEARQLLETIRRNDAARMAQMVTQMERHFSACGLRTGLDEQAVVEMVVRRHGCDRRTVYLQERHISQAFQEALFAQLEPAARIPQLNKILGAATKARDPDDFVAVQNDLRAHLMKAGKPAFVAETFVSFDDAYRLVLELGGLPCYPTVADGASPISQIEASPDKLIAEIRARNIHAVEWVPVRNSVQLLREYALAMRAAGLVVTAGTEHNTLDLIPLDPFCRDGQVPEELRTLFWEGACVVAGHQFLTLHGACGFVDGAGNPNPDYASADERIAAVAGIGAAVIQRYYEACRGA
ncbi:MAG: hypothetical protein GXY58_07270 [Planctomycetaceae bacterium]|nr:hypothetical protein [Planctomycetaceae bacterium]